MQNVNGDARNSVSYDAGMNAAALGKNLAVAVRCLRTGTKQYYDFCDGYDSVIEAKRLERLAKRKKLSAAMIES